MATPPYSQSYQLEVKLDCTKLPQMVNLHWHTIWFLDLLGPIYGTPHLLLSQGRRWLIGMLSMTSFINPCRLIFAWRCSLFVLCMLCRPSFRSVFQQSSNVQSYVVSYMLSFASQGEHSIQDFFFLHAESMATTKQPLCPTLLARLVCDQLRPFQLLMHLRPEFELLRDNSFIVLLRRLVFRN